MWLGVHGRSEPTPSTMVLTPCPFRQHLVQSALVVESLVSRAGGGACWKNWGRERKEVKKPAEEA